MERVVPVNKTVIDYIEAYDIDGTTLLTGKVAGDFTKQLFRNGVSSAVTVTITEIGTTGIYTVQLSPNAIGYWFLRIKLNWSGRVLTWGFQVDDTLSAQVIVSSVATGGTTTTLIDTALSGGSPVETGNIADLYKDAVIIIRNGTTGRVHHIAQITAFSTSTSTFTLFPATRDNNAVVSGETYAVVSNLVGALTGNVLYRSPGGPL